MAVFFSDSSVVYNYAGDGKNCLSQEEVMRENKLLEQTARYIGSCIYTRGPFALTIQSLSVCLSVCLSVSVCMCVCVSVCLCVCTKMCFGCRNRFAEKEQRDRDDLNTQIKPSPGYNEHIQVIAARKKVVLP